MSLKKAYKEGRVRPLNEAFKELPPEEEWNGGKIDYFIKEEKGNND